MFVATRNIAIGANIYGSNAGIQFQVKPISTPLIACGGASCITKCIPVRFASAAVVAETLSAYFTCCPAAEAASPPIASGSPARGFAWTKQNRSSSKSTRLTPARHSRCNRSN